MTDSDAVPVSGFREGRMTISGSCGSSQDTATQRQELFQKLDTNGDGKISKDELGAALANQQSSGGANSKGPSLDDLFSRIDTNGDGSIDQSENDAFLSSVQKGGGHHHH